jgi:hypothetical protein
LTSRSYGGRLDASSPCKRICPLVGSSKPPISRRHVVLPEPDGPSIEKNSPSSIASDTRSTARTSPKRRLTSRSSTAMVMWARQPG